MDIIATSDEQMIAIRPICEALGIDADSQRKRIERDEILSPTAVMMTVVAADGKDRENIKAKTRTGSVAEIVTYWYENNLK